MLDSVLIVSEAFCIGGLETHLAGEMRKLAKRGCRVHFAVGREFCRDLLPESLVSVSSGLRFGCNGSVADILHDVALLRALIRKEHIECLHLHPYSTLIPGALAAELEGVPYVVTLHGPASLGRLHGATFEFILKYLVLPAAGLVVVISEEVRQLASAFVSDGRIVNLPNAVDAEEFSGECNSSLAVDARWLVVSRLDYHKIVGILDFAVKAEAAGITGLRIVGDGEAKGELERRLVEAGLTGFAEFLGARADVPCLMQRSVGVAGMGRVVLEAVACGKPAVLVGYDGVKGVINHKLLEAAAVANFSGRNLVTCDTPELAKALSTVEPLNCSSLPPNLGLFFDEGRIWEKFFRYVDAVSYQGPTLLTEVNKCLLDEDWDTEPFLQSPKTHAHLGLLVNSVRHVKPHLNLAFINYSAQFEASATSISVAQQLAEKDARAQELAQEVITLDAHAQALAREVGARDAGAQLLAQQLAEKDAQAQELAQEVIRLDAHAQVLAREVGARDADAQLLALDLIHARAEMGVMRKTIRKQDAILVYFRPSLWVEKLRRIF